MIHGCLCTCTWALCGILVLTVVPKTWAVICTLSKSEQAGMWYLTCQNECPVVAILLTLQGVPELVAILTVGLADVMKTISFDPWLTYLGGLRKERGDESRTEHSVGVAFCSKNQVLLSMLCCFFNLVKDLSCSEVCLLKWAMSATL